MGPSALACVVHVSGGRRCSRRPRSPGWPYRREPATIPLVGRIVAVLFALTVSAGCGPDRFVCSSAADCDSSRPGGECEVNGSCSFPDDRCPSKRRYGEHAEAGLANTCVPADDASSSAATSDDASTTDPGGPALCGNGVAEPGEECDDEDLARATCQSGGYDAGILRCSTDCTFDTAACSNCGNAVIEGNEVCDRDAIVDTCVSRGFVGGTLACADGCGAYDESGCHNCGNAVIDGDESCDVELGAASCLTLGFASGTLACDAACAFDTTLCDVGACGVDPMPTAGVCPPACTTCDQDTCQIECTAGSDCPGGVVTCPPGWNCHISCAGPDACASSTLECPDLYGCAVDCAGVDACYQMVMNCSETGACSLTCDYRLADVCFGATLMCGQDACSGQCNGTDLVIDCGDSCECTPC